MTKITYKTINGTFTVIYAGKSVTQALKHFKAQFSKTQASIINILKKS